VGETSFHNFRMCFRMDFTDREKAKFAMFIFLYLTKCRMFLL